MLFGFTKKKTDERTESISCVISTVGSTIRNAPFQEYRIGDICEMRNRGSDYYKQSEFVGPHEGAMIIQPPNIENNRLIFSGIEMKYYSWAGYNKKPDLNIEIGDLLLVKMAAPGAPFKSAVVYELPEPAITNSSIHILKKIKCNPSYLQLIISSAEFQAQLRAKQTKSTIPTIGQSTIADMTILLPPRAVQDEIVELLGGYREKNHSLIEELNQEIEARKKQYDYYADAILWNNL